MRALMKAGVVWTAAVAAMLVVAGCNKAESPEKVQSDINKAVAAADKKDERAADREARTDASVTNDLAHDVDKANAKEIDAAADDAMTQAEGENKIALAKCEALAGDAQKSCKDAANARLKLAKDRAKALKSDRG